MDADKIHRWLTEAELQELLNQAREAGRKGMDEKLRALLAEAREVARAVRNAGSLPYAQWSRDQHEADSFMERIDAALAGTEVKP
jgi:NTP pyrophosphatase (non-canonical NTP hydrolase)